MREGRLAPGGRGLLDVRLSRATPTWITRLDGRHMAFLKDHRVENMIVFPAAGFVEMVLEAGAQLVRGQTLRRRGFRNSQAADPAGSAVRSAPRVVVRARWNAPSPSRAALKTPLHGRSMSSDRCAANAPNRRLRRPTWETSRALSLESVGIDTFYGHMSDLGLLLRRGIPAHPRTSAGGGQVGRTRFASARRSPDARPSIPLHPVLFDGALQIFSAGAATIEGRTAGLEAPSAFRPDFVSPLARRLRASCAAGVKQANDEFVEGGIDFYDEDGQPCVRIDGFRAISVEGSRRSGRTGKGRDLVYHIAWEKAAPLGKAFAPCAAALDAPARRGEAGPG